MDVGGAFVIHGDKIELNSAAAILARGDKVSLNDSSSGAALADDLEMNYSRTGLTIARTVDMENSSSVVLLANEVHGPVETMLDTRDALLAGLVAGIGIGLVLTVFRLIARRR
jgi:hypothetical protein